jgi:predicted Zn-dependent protease
MRWLAIAPLLVLMTLTMLFGCECLQRAQRRDVTVTFPDDCARRATVVIVPLGKELSAPLHAWSKRFTPSDGGGRDVTFKVTEPMTLPEQAWSPEHGQYQAESIIESLNAFAWHGRGEADAQDVIAIGVTDRDLRLATMPDWRWGFGLYMGDTAVVSVHRMAYPAAPSRPFSPVMQARLSRHMARVLGSLHCGYSRTGPPSSVMRKQVLGVDDLDEIDLGDWRR